MNLIDALVATLIISVIAISSAGFLTYSKDMLVDSENYYEATKASMEKIEQFQQPLLSYTNGSPEANLSVGLHNDTSADIDSTYDLKTKFTGTRTYNVNESNWGSSAYKYKDITVTTSWQYKGNTKSVSLEILKRDDDT